MKHREPVRIHIVQSDLSGGELASEVIKTDKHQGPQRGHSPRRLDTKVYGQRVEADRSVNMREPGWRVVFDVLHLRKATRAISPVARV